jgi:phospholipid/cholesterol/gamma-HCH transport system permease protein
MRTLEALGASILSLCEETARFFTYLGQVLVGTVVPPWDVREILRQMVRVGVQSIPVVFFTAAFTGGVIALQTYAGFARFRAEGFVGGVVALSMLREIAPVLTALMVIARVGSSISAEIGSMRASEQIDALVAMGTEPVKYLFVPRVVAGTIMLPLLTILADGVSIIGGRTLAVWMMDANVHQYDYTSFAYTDFRDFWSGIFKATVFGAVFTLITCQKGFHASGGAEGVGRATTQGVVTASVAIVVVDFFLTRLVF